MCLLQALGPFDFKVLAVCAMITHEFYFHLVLLKDKNFNLSLIYFGFKLTFHKNTMVENI